MIIDKASEKEIDELVELRLAYLQEDLGSISEQDMQCLRVALPQYFRNHLNRDLLVYIAKEAEEILTCAFLLIVEKPMSPMFITGKTGTVLNVYTKPEYRKKGYAKQLMNALLEDAKANELSVIELKATEDGYHLYKSVGFEDVVSKYHNMRYIVG
ncbi:MAG: GNAT family N-acetyltransferase [Lachnospiraceae bacterium]|nr:GNAT family N-acetyltransferase [Lachnospiraceae bacterium]MBQ8547349.1 GNAT family N-acetyltransferase [Lachnospiraceae bacterium]